MMFVHLFLSVLAFSIPCNSIPYPDLYNTAKETFPTQNEIISATLRDLETGYVYQVKQYISATRGFIRTDITDGQMSMQLYQSKDSPDRYSIEDGNCDNTYWPQSEDERWFLLAGPYTLLQSDAFTCYDTDVEVHTEKIRGYTDLIETVKKCNQASEVIISWIAHDKQKDKPIAIRIETQTDKYQLDIFERIPLGEKEESTILRLPAGNGCTNLKLTETFMANSPSMDDIRFTSVLSQKDLTLPARTEIFIDQDHQYARMESFEDENSIVYDLKLGVQYSFVRKDGEILCESGPIQDGPLQTIYKWLQAYQDDFKSKGKFDQVQYLGKGFCNSGKILICHIWELIGTNYMNEGTKFDKFVVVFYAFEKMKTEKEIFHVPSAFERFGYQRKGGKFSREFWQRNDIHAFTNPTYEEIMDTEYRLEKCYDNPESRKTFDLSLALDGGDPTEFRQLFGISDQIKRGIRESFASRGTISLSRIIGIELVQMDGESDRRILAAVSFVTKPTLQKSFSVADVHVDLDPLKDQTEKLPLSKCMTSLSEKNIRNFIFYRADNLCISLTDEQASTIETKKGKTFCQMYQNKADEPKDVVLEKAVEDLSGELQEFVSKQPAFSINIGNKQRKMQIMQVFSHKGSFSTYDIPTAVMLQKKFVSEDKKKVTTIQTTMADCRRICKDAELTQCNSFSYCEAPNGIGECSLVSYSTALSDPSIVQDSPDCDLYTLSSLSLFEKGEEGHMKFTQPYESMADGDPELCAKKCLEDNKCKSFAVCRGSDLTFGCDLFSKPRPPVSMDYEQLCTLYSPRDAFSFGVTNDDVVGEVFVTRDAVPFKLCSQMCQRSREIPCMSFNYCEESNQCQLATTTVASSSNLKKVPGCLNHQRDYDYTPPNRSPAGPIIETVTTLSGAGVFGIVVTFFVVGLALGAIGLIMVLQYRARIAVSSLSLSTFRWHRQQDEVEVGHSEISDNNA